MREGGGILESWALRHRDQLGTAESTVVGSQGAKILASDLG